jgi:hypothetical protein
VAPPWDCEGGGVVWLRRHRNRAGFLGRSPATPVTYPALAGRPARRPTRAMPCWFRIPGSDPRAPRYASLSVVSFILGLSFRTAVRMLTPEATDKGWLDRLSPRASKRSQNGISVVVQVRDSGWYLAK